MKINIDEKIENFKCPERVFCIVATTCLDPIKREHLCYKCWLAYCKQNNIEIEYAGLAQQVEQVAVG